MTSQVIAAMRPAAEHGGTPTLKEIVMRPILFLAFAAFGAFSLYAMWAVGYVGIWQAGMASVGAWQLLVDFVITSFILLGFIARDAKATGRTVWPYALITLAAGSFGPLLYLLLAPRESGARLSREATA